MDAEFEMPNNNDQLFKNAINYADHNAAIRTGITNFFVYSEGYKLAAEKLLGQTEGNAWNANMLVYPIVFTTRQYLELRLKELICGLNYIINHEYKFKDGHDLIKLWDEFISLDKHSERQETMDSTAAANARKIIDEFNLVDQGSYAFRYPVDKSVDRNPSHNMKYLDLNNFQTVMNRLSNFLEQEGERIFYLIDQTEEYISIMRSEYF